MNLLRYIFVPGVGNYAGNPDAWTDRACTSINLRQTCEAAEKFEYTALPLSRFVLAQRRAKALAKLIDKYPIDSFSLVVVGHSNGCDLILRAIRLAKRPVNWVHFFAPAISSNPRSHRLVKLIQDGRIGFLRIHLASRDRVLTRAHLGGIPMADVQAQFAQEHHAEIDSESFGHSGWWRPERFEKTMRQICGDPLERKSA